MSLIPDLTQRFKPTNIEIKPTLENIEPEDVRHKQPKLSFLVMAFVHATKQENACELYRYGQSFIDCEEVDTIKQQILGEISDLLGAEVNKDIYEEYFNYFRQYSTAQDTHDTLDEAIAEKIENAESVSSDNHLELAILRAVLFDLRLDAADKEASLKLYGPSGYNLEG